MEGTAAMPGDEREFASVLDQTALRLKQRNMNVEVRSLPERQILNLCTVVDSTTGLQALQCLEQSYLLKSKSFGYESSATKVRNLADLCVIVLVDLAISINSNNSHILTHRNRSQN